MKVSAREWVGLAVLVLAVSSASQWWGGRVRGQIGQQVAALAQPGDIRMLASETCGICASARQWFTDHRIAYTECTIERDAACRSAFEATGSPGTPVLLVRGRSLVGFDPERVRRTLQPAG